ncbi:hypothetical protein Q5P01_000526 [Channa striata]|uniref:Uncharacterized protein n=1 Tax=Channa striata TaxID=64152 RepID=A0AA88IXB9_CHASR|nr:hypothetical protein Q5P01_000526 [Channa striata]
MPPRAQLRPGGVGSLAAGRRPTSERDSPDRRRVNGSPRPPDPERAGAAPGTPENNQQYLNATPPPLSPHRPTRREANPRALSANREDIEWLLEKRAADPAETLGRRVSLAVAADWRGEPGLGRPRDDERERSERERASEYERLTTDRVAQAVLIRELGMEGAKARVRELQAAGPGGGRARRLISSFSEEWSWAPRRSSGLLFRHKHALLSALGLEPLGSESYDHTNPALSHLYRVEKEFSRYANPYTLCLAPRQCGKSLVMKTILAAVLLHLDIDVMVQAQNKNMCTTLRVGVERAMEELQQLPPSTAAKRSWACAGTLKTERTLSTRATRDRPSFTFCLLVTTHLGSRRLESSRTAGVIAWDLRDADRSVVVLHVRRRSRPQYRLVTRKCRVSRARPGHLHGLVFSAAPPSSRRSRKWKMERCSKGGSIATIRSGPRDAAAEVIKGRARPTQFSVFVPSTWLSDTDLPSSASVEAPDAADARLQEDGGERAARGLRSVNRSRLDHGLLPHQGGRLGRMAHLEHVRARPKPARGRRSPSEGRRSSFRSRRESPRRSPFGAHREGILVQGLRPRSTRRAEIDPMLGRPDSGFAGRPSPSVRAKGRFSARFLEHRAGSSSKTKNCSSARSAPSSPP